MAGTPCDPSSAGLVDLLEARSQDITRRWEGRMRQSLPSTEFHSELAGLLPKFLARMGAALRSELRGGGLATVGSLEAIAEAHGRQCFQRGLDVSAVAREHSVLRDVILDGLAESSCLLDSVALRRLLDMLAAATAEALRHHALEHERVVRAERERTEAELRESETRYRLASLAISDAVWDWDLITDHVSWSDAIHRITGRARGDVAPVFTWWTEHIHPDDRERVVGGILAAIRDGDTYWMDEYRFLRADGTWMVVSDRGYVARDTQGRAVRMVGAFQDITERKVAEQEALRRTEFEQHLIGIVSHDLRNPLNAISMAASLLLKQDGLEESRKRSLRRIVSSAARATRLLRDLLDFTQARLSGSLPVTPRPLELHELTRQVADEVQLAHPDRRLVVERSGDGHGEWDADRLAQLITNLVNNALTYGDEHRPVTVRTRGDPEEVVLSVHNLGKPISPEMMNQLFQPLQRGVGAGSKGHSIGLGLFIVKHITDAHGGRIHVDSSRERGTTFTVSLPRHPPQPRKPASP